MNISVTTSPTSQLALTLRHIADTITITGGLQDYITFVMNGETIFIGTKHDLQEALLSVENKELLINPPMHNEFN